MVIATVVVTGVELYEIYNGEHGRRNVRETEFENMTDEEVDDIARNDPNPERRRRAQTEQKGRRRRNGQKRGKCD